jgi:DNA-binding transcriptional regulator LsrR (DeoR family)
MSIHPNKLKEEIKMNKYAIWNKKDLILTPIGEVLTAEQWIQRYPIAGVETITVICAAGEINGGFFGTLGQMVELYTNMGCDFSACKTAEDKLAAIESFEDAKEAEARAAAEAAANEISTDERIAAALEAQVLMSMPDEEV